jgi:integrase
VELFEKKNSKFYWYDFTVRGKRYRGSTKQTTQVKAEKVAALKLAQALEDNNPLDRKTPVLRELSSRFLEWVNTARLADGSRNYYRNGWKLLQDTSIAGMKLDQITTDDAEALRFPGSPAKGNNALRTLSRMLSKAKEWKLLRYVPDFKLFKETGRTLKLDDEAERKLLPHAEQPLRDIIVIMRDTGMRNGRELYRMRIENIDWANRVVFNPDSKTAKGRRFVPLSDRVLEILKVRCAGRTQGWVFPGSRKGKHISYDMVNKRWLRARKAAGLPETLVLYCARHDFGSYVMRRTGNLKAVMDAMGHSSVNVAMNYQHPELDIVRNAINSRHILGHTGQTQPLVSS